MLCGSYCCDMFCSFTATTLKSTRRMVKQGRTRATKTIWTCRAIQPEFRIESSPPALLCSTRPATGEPFTNFPTSHSVQIAGKRSVDHCSRMFGSSGMYVELRNITFCPRVNDLVTWFQTVLCPHKVLAHENIYTLPEKTSHFKIVRPLVRFQGIKMR